MTPERWEQVGEIYHAASELDGEARESYLQVACSGDEELRREVESLLRASEGESNLVDKPLGAAAAELFDPGKTVTLVGRKLGPYQIQTHLGAGGIGEVYLARDTRLGRTVALKTLSSTFAADPHWLQRLKTEASAAATLNHPNIATVYSVEEIDDCSFITMEYIDGAPLSALIPEGGLDLPRFYEWFLPLADALAHAHEHGITHRDLKPGNVMITHDGAPKLLDFGLARIDRPADKAATPAADPDTGDSEREGLTRAGQILGTPSYMSPEQARGEAVDQRADIFGFGVVMYEALTGQRPFQGDSYAAIISEVLKVDPPTVSDLKPETPDLLARLIGKCLRKERRSRFQTMREVVALLYESRDSTPRSSGRIRSAVIRARRRISARLVIAALSLIVAALSGAFIWNRFFAVEVAAPVNARYAIQPAEPQAELSTAALSPDGRHLVYGGNLGDGPRLFLRSLDQFDARPLPGTEGGQRSFFSPDSRWIAFFVDSKLKKIPIEGGAALTICDDCPRAIEGVWGEDGTIIMTSSDAGLSRVPAGGGRPGVLTQPDAARNEIAHRRPQFVEGGASLLFSRQFTKGITLALLNLATGEMEDLLELGDAIGVRMLPTGDLCFARAGQLFIQPFDLRARRALGDAVPVLDGLHQFPNFQIARNGTLVYLPNTAMRDNLLVWVDRRGQTTPALDRRGDFRSPRISPDGRRIAVEIERDIWIIEIPGGRSIRLTFESDNHSPVWTPDGNRVIYASNRGGVWAIYSQEVGSVRDPERLHTNEYRVLPYTVHPRGDHLVFAQGGIGLQTDMFSLSLSGREATPLIASPFTESTPRYSPDGRWLAYFSDESGRPEIYIQPATSPGARVPVSRGGGMNPVWAPDGSELYYRWQTRLYAVGVNTIGAEIKLGEPRVLAEGRFLTSYDVAGDGRRFLMVRNEQGVSPRQFHVVLNWLNEFR
ncbi:MAG: PD40 domain-containing protein [Acidobacteria bacterium]|nr:PD40 domain-containing protein [Acidobacteriota bacterium]MCW5971498.1 PD40 domain-containing protein [Blastocatellales bacterium]